MSVTVGETTFDRVDYDADADVLYLHVGDGAELYDYPLQYEKRRAHLQVVIRAGQVAGLFERLGEPSGRWKRSRGMWRQVFRPSPA